MAPPLVWLRRMQLLREKLVIPQVPPSLGSLHHLAGKLFYSDDQVDVYRYFTATIWNVSKCPHLHSWGEFPFTRWR